MRTMIGLIAAIAAGAAPSHAAELYSQPTTSDDANVGLGWFSHAAPRPTRNFKHADDFVLAETSSIERVTWWGISENLVHPDLTNFTGFAIEFWSPNAAGVKPETIIVGDAFTLAETNATATGRTSSSGAIEYRHAVNLATPVELEDGATWFISISAFFVDESGDAWQWQDADFVNGLSASYDYSRDRWQGLFDTDSAFVLEGTAVPAPGGAALLIGTGLLGARRRRL
ncbi:MAG: hypothetical protein RIB60_02215 [Phycisphaerales bacterium]